LNPENQFDDSYNPESVKFKVSSYGLRPQEQVQKYLDLSILDTKYNDWLKDDESLGEILNPKLAKLKSSEFRQKVETWKARKGERTIIKKRNNDHG
jgi:hypothetical protein